MRAYQLLLETYEASEKGGESMKGLNTEKFLKTLYELTARQHGVKISVTITDKKGRLAATEESNSGQEK